MNITLLSNFLSQKIKYFSTEKIIIYLFTVISFFIWSGYSFTHLNNYDEWRLYLIAIISIIIIYSISANYKYIYNYYKFNPSLLYYIVLIIGTFSSLYSKYPVRAFRDFSYYICFFLACFSLGIILRKNPKASYLTLKLIAILPFIFILMFFYNLFFVLYINNLYYPIYFTEIWPLQFSINRIFGDTILPIIFIVYYFLLSTKKHKKIIFTYFFILLIIFMFSGGRGSLISFYIVLIFGYLSHRSIRKPIINLILLSLLAFVFSLILVYLINEPNQIIFRSDSTGRFEIIHECLRRLKENLLLGIGPAHFSHAVLNANVSHPHNILLQMTVEWGILVTTSTLLIFSTIIITILKKYLSETNSLNIFLFLSFISFILNCNFNGAHIYPSSQFYILFITSYLISLNLVEIKNHKKYITASNNIISISMVTLLIITTYLALNCADPKVSSKINLQGPRFWLFDSPHDDQICN